VVIDREKTGKDETVLEEPIGRPELAKKTVAKRPTVKRPWTAINAASTNEKAKFLGLLHDLCKSIPQPTKPKGPDKGGPLDSHWPTWYSP